jgi:hypothetical protein
MVIPLAPSHIPAKFRPNLVDRASREGFIMLRVGAFVLFIAFLCAAAMFSQGNPFFVCMCVLGALLCLLGFHGATRAYAPTIFIFWAGLLLWMLGLLGTVLYLVFVSSDSLATARRRCQDNLYVARFGDACVVNPERCRADCVRHVETHLVASTAVFGGMAVVLLLFAALQARSFYRQLVFADEEDATSPDDDADVVYTMNELAAEAEFRRSSGNIST